MSLTEAKMHLKMKYPSRQVMQAIDYDDSWYLLMAVEDPESIDYDSPWYAVNKRTGDVRTFNPIDQLEKFTDALYNRRV